MSKISTRLKLITKLTKDKVYEIDNVKQYILAFSVSLILFIVCFVGSILVVNNINEVEKSYYSKEICILDQSPLVLEETVYTSVEEDEIENKNTNYDFIDKRIMEDIEKRKTQGYDDIIIRDDIEDIIEDSLVYVDFNHPLYTVNSSVKNPSGLTAYQIDELLEGTNLYGIGESVIYIEEEYGIDAFYTISVAALESGYGTSSLARNYNNLFGLVNCKFKSHDSCVEYFGRLMQKYEENHNVVMTPSGINKRYCTSDDWNSKITKIMNTYVEKANDLY